MFWRLVKTALFTIVAPRAVALYLPQMLRDASADHRGPLRLRLSLVLFLCGAAIYLRCAWDFAAKGLGTPAPIDAPVSGSHFTPS